MRFNQFGSKEKGKNCGIKNFFLKSEHKKPCPPKKKISPMLLIVNLKHDLKSRTL